MFTKSQKYAFQLIVQLIALSIVVLLFQCDSYSGKKPVNRETLPRDIRESGLDLAQNTVNLNGAWLFRYGTEQSDCHDFDTTQFNSKANVERNAGFIEVQTPSSWGNYSQAGKTLPPSGIACYRLPILMTPYKKDSEHEYYALYIQEIQAAAEISWNGKLIGKKGKVGNSIEKEYPDIRDDRIFLIPSGWIREENQLSILISNYHLKSGGIYNSVQLGTKEKVLNLIEGKRIYSSFILGAIILAGLYYFTLWLVEKNQKAYLWFFLTCLFISVRLLAADSLLEFFLEGNWVAQFRKYCEYITPFSLASISFPTLLKYQYPKVTFRYSYYFILTNASVIGLIVTISHKELEYGKLLPLFGIFLLANILICLYFLYRCARKKEKYANIILYSFLFFGVTAILDLITAILVVDNIYFAPMGLFTFIYSMVAILGLEIREKNKTLKELAENYKQAEIMAKEKEESLRLIIANAPIYLFITDRNGTISIVEGNKKKKSGNFNRFAGKNIFSITRFHPGIKQCFSKALQGEHSSTTFATLSKEQYEVSCAPLKDNNGKLLGSIAVGVEVTEKLLLEEKLRHSQKMEVVGRMAGKLAHDFNNLLTTMMLNIDNINTHKSPDFPFQKQIDILDKTVEQAAFLTGQLLALSKKQFVKSQPIDLNLSIQKLQGIITRLMKKQVKLEVVTNDFPLIIQADQEQLEQIVMNMVLNAQDAMSKTQTKGVLKITVDYTRTAYDISSQDVIQNGEFARLQIEDNGCGIPENIFPKMFEPFITTKETNKGGGLGLSIVYGIVKQNLGYINVTTEKNKGSKFEIYFPLIQPNAFPYPKDPIMSKKNLAYN